MTDSTQPVITFTLATVRSMPLLGYTDKQLCKSLGIVDDCSEDTSITIDQIYQNCGLSGISMLLGSYPKYNNLWRHFAIDCVSQVKHLIQQQQFLDALDVARRYADDDASDADLDAARLAMREAAGRSEAFGPNEAAWWTASLSKTRFVLNAMNCSASASTNSANCGYAFSATMNAIHRAQICLLAAYCRLGRRPEGSEQLLAKYIEEELDNVQHPCR